MLNPRRTSVQHHHASPIDVKPPLQGEGDQHRAGAPRAQLHASARQITGEDICSEEQIAPRQALVRWPTAHHSCRRPWGTAGRRFPTVPCMAGAAEAPVSEGIYAASAFAGIRGSSPGTGPVMRRTEGRRQTHTQGIMTSAAPVSSVPSVPMSPVIGPMRA